MMRWLVAILVPVTVLLHAVCGGRCGSGVVVYFDPHEHGAGVVHEHREHEDPHCRGAWDHHEEEPGSRDHVHLCRGEPDATRPERAVVVPRIEPVVVAVVVFEAESGAVRRAGVAARPSERWGVGPPPCIRTTRLLI